jgi:hypothetical protein
MNDSEVRVHRVRRPKKYQPAFLLYSWPSMQLHEDGTRWIANLARRRSEMGEQIIEHLHVLRSLVEGLDMQNAWIELNHWVNTNNLHVNHAQHGACMPIQVSRMECWKRSQLRPMTALEPNYATREASLCAGCACFAMDERHKPFWMERYIENEACDRRLTGQGFEGPEVREIRRRAEQAKKKLLALGEDLHKLNEKVVIRLEAYEST